MKEKSLPRRGFKERKKEIERFFLYLLLPCLVSLSLRFLFLPSTHSLSAIPKLGTQNKSLGIDRKKERKKKIAQTQIPMEYVSSNYHHSSSLIRTCVFFVFVFRTCIKKKKSNCSFHFFGVFLHFYVQCLYPFDSPNRLPFLLST